MRITINREKLLDATVHLWGVVPTFTPYSALGCLRIVAAGERLLCAASDLEVFCEVDLWGGHQGDGAFLILAKTLKAILKKSDTEIITFSADKPNAIRVTARRFSAKLLTYDVEDYPTTPTTPEDATWTHVPNGLTAAMKRVMFAVAREETRLNLAGVHLEQGEMLTLVATDGHRAAVAEVDDAGGLAIPGEGITIPIEGCRLMVKLIEVAEAYEGARIAVTPKDIFLRGANHNVAIRLTSADYPNWRSAIPADDKFVTTAWVHRASLLEVLGRVSVLDSAVRMVFSFAGETLSLSAVGDNGTADEELDCLIGGADVTAKFNPRYWIEALKQMESERARARFVEGGEGPCIITGEDDPGVMHLIMPMMM